jgi:hypothetical protein
MRLLYRSVVSERTMTQEPTHLVEPHAIQQPRGCREVSERVGMVLGFDGSPALRAQTVAGVNQKRWS